MNNYMQPDQKFLTWFESMSNRPGTMVLSYTLDGLSPFEYQFVPTEPNLPMSCGFRMFLHDDNGKVADVDYFSVYPQVSKVDGDGRKSAVDVADAAAELASAPADYWQLGWAACLQQGSVVISMMQTKHVYKMAEAVGFDVDHYGSLVEAVCPDSAVIIGMVLARLRAEVLLHKATTLTGPEERKRVVLAACSLMNNLSELAIQVLCDGEGVSE